MTEQPAGAYGADNDIVDYILGITFEIWEQRGVELIDNYYADDVVVYALDGVLRGSRAMIDATTGTLEAFTDRQLLGDDVVVSGNRQDGYYSSHRVLSPMTNTGASVFGPATGKAVRIMNIADCVVEDGVITGEWLMRDNHALVSQLGFDPQVAARSAAARLDAESRAWIASEFDRVDGLGVPDAAPSLSRPGLDVTGFARKVLGANWLNGDDAVLASAYAPYAVLHRSPVWRMSGRDAVGEHFADLRRAIEVTGLSVDHVASQPHGEHGMHLAARWAVAGRHTGEYLGLTASGKPVFILGATHWRIVADRIAVECTVFDNLGLMGQILAP